MTPGDDSGHGLGGDDLAAAEYVVGLSPTDERRASSDRIERDPAFARLVDGWEAYFSPLADAYAPVEPPHAIKPAIDRRLFGSHIQPSSGAVRVPSGGLWSSLAFWRGLAMASLAAMVLYAGAISLQEPTAPPRPQQLVASLAADGSDVRYVAVYDPARGEIGLSHVAGQPGADHTFELWMIEGQNPPVSMGVIPDGAIARLGVDDDAKAKLAAGAVLAISIEPDGGSPADGPTGPVVATGNLTTI